MKSWMFMMTAGIVALLGGLLALFNPTGVGNTTVTLLGWTLIIVAVLQGWATYRSTTSSARLQAGGIAVAAAFLGFSLLFGPFGSGSLLRWLLGLLLIASGAAKIFAGRAMVGTDNRLLVFGTGAVSAVMGLIVLFGLNLNFGTLLAVELLASGLGLVLLAMYRRANA
ncbi:DUF308 domain-containing protein [Thiothrix eikelboomii]|uniref:DUF308 domain-containing protein n=1 Tax=Thiothrix eikelboomii TaxID=92487 RepID=UPI003BAF5805